MKAEIQQLIDALSLIPHPEGGFYKEVYRSDKLVGKHQLATSIYFLLTSENVSNFHRIQSDELWFHHKGSDLIVHTLTEVGHTQHLLGSDLSTGAVPQVLVPGNTIFGSSIVEVDSYALVSCVVAPGFEFSEFELFDAATLLAQFPAHAAIIDQLTIA